ncbi:hypothetical protein AHAS_Ahas04G0135100 [Arachis hypogaea]
MEVTVVAFGDRHRGGGHRWPLLLLEITAPSRSPRHWSGASCRRGGVAAIRVEVTVEVKCVWRLCVMEKKKKKKEVVCDGCV